MNALAIIMLVFAVLGALDRMFGNKLGLGAEFERGFNLLGTMALSMIGMIVLSPVIADLLSPVLDLVYNSFGIDPSVIPASIFANDMGGAPMSVEVGKNADVALFNALVVSSMMGCTVSFNIPYAVSAVDKKHHRELFLGMLCGTATIPLGCFVGGLFCKLPLSALLLTLLPLILFAALIVLGLIFIPNICVKVFAVFGYLIKALITVGLVLGMINFISGKEIIKGLSDIEGASLICINAAIFLSGAFPLMHLISKLLKKPINALGQKAGINTVSAFGFISTLVTNVTTYEKMKDMDAKGIVLNSAFAVSAAFVFGGHLGFTLAFDPSLAFPVIIGKLVAGITALILALLISKKITAEKP
ncbi:MAG: ethanolamine utilization protein EutH [Clostridia bacterium]|nr:ethanolamine utilization protein EutH [Clostridia bacterium]